MNLSLKLCIKIVLLQTKKNTYRCSPSKYAYYSSSLNKKDENNFVICCSTLISIIMSTKKWYDNISVCHKNPCCRHEQGVPYFTLFIKRRHFGLHPTRKECKRNFRHVIENLHKIAFYYKILLQNFTIKAHITSYIYGVPFILTSNH